MVDFTTDINNLDSARILESRDTVVDLLSTQFPSLRGFQPGGQLEGIIAEPIGIGFAWIDLQMDLQDASFSIATIASDPDAASSDLIDLRLSDYFISRQEATSSFGNALLIFSASSIFPLRNGFRFNTANFTFVTTRSFRIFPPNTREEDASNGILVMEERSDGTFQVEVPLESVQTGPDTRIKRGTALEPESSIPNLTSATAATDFLGGLAADTNADLVERAQQGITPGTFCGARQGENLIEREFPGTLSRIVGAGNELMTRDRDNMFQISTGGKIDVYVRTTNEPNTKTITVTARLTPDNRNDKRWLFNFSEPGAYEVIAVRDVGAGENNFSGIYPESQTIESELPTAGFVPALTNGTAYFTTHQRHFVKFIDESLDYTSLLSGAGPTDVIERSYDVDVLFMPAVEEIDDFARGDDQRDAALDPVVRAAVPFFIDVNVQVRGSVSLTAARTAVVNAVLGLPAGSSRIPANLVYDALRPHVTGTLGTVRFRGEVITKDLQHLFYTSNGEITVPHRPNDGVTSDSVMFMTSVDRVTIEVVE